MTSVFFSNHSLNPHYVTTGSSPELLTDLFAFVDARIDHITELNICLYLFNNEILHNKLKAWSQRGIQVNVVSIPLEGYDNRYPKDIYDPITNMVSIPNATKYTLAQSIYNDIIGLHSPNYRLYIFGHIYVRSESFSNFSRGKLPYSLHTKSFFIKLDDGNSITGLTSSNLAVRDESKNELMILIEDSQSTQAESELFFHNLISNSSDVSSWADPHPNYIYTMPYINTGAPLNNYFTAPFFLDSPYKIKDKISDILTSAQNRILVCAEHLAAYNYKDIFQHNTLVPGIFSIVFDKCRHGIPIRLLSQTYVDAHGNSHGQREPQNKASFIEFSRAVDSLAAYSCEYAINKYVHAKFIIVDNTAIISTANYTPTEFIYGDRNITRFNDPALSGVCYNGKFAEVEHFIILEDSDLVGQLIDFYDSTVNDANTYIHGSTPATTTPTTLIVGNSYNNSYHRPDCRYAPRDPSKRREFSSVADARTAGFRPCRTCNP